MKLNTLEKLLWSLEDLEYKVVVPEDTARRARAAIRRMLEVSDPGGYAQRAGLPGPAV